MGDGANLRINHGGHDSATIQQRSSSFHGVGPTLSWSNSTGLAGDVDDGQLALDWGANAAVLFGRQKVKVDYSTIAHFNQATVLQHVVSVTHQTAVNRTQSRRVTVPNLGGFAALSYRFTNAKLSAGYRADFFFGALDGGPDTRHTMTTGYHGPIRHHQLRPGRLDIFPGGRRATVCRRPLFFTDTFFGPMDVGIDARHIADRDFHGPFAKISIGLGE